MQLDWLDEGAIQLVLPESLLDRWSGIDSSDYDRACSSGDDWINQITVGGGLGLVLGGDNAMPLVVPADDGSIVIIRWIFGEDERELVAFALSGEGIQRTEADLVFDNAESTWRLFDDAADLLAHGPSSRTVSLPLTLGGATMNRRNHGIEAFRSRIASYTIGDSLCLCTVSKSRYQAGCSSHES